jgi:ABC-type nitrate/sulfonate/bicarbonate transport system substrate-binding protein
VDAALLAQPLSIMVVEQGVSNLGDAYKLMPAYQLSGIGVREGWAQKNREIVVRYLRALVSTYRWLHDNREEAIKILPAITKLDTNILPSPGKPTRRRKFGRAMENRRCLRVAVAAFSTCLHRRSG